MEKFTIREIIKFVKFSDVKRAIKFYYPNDKNDYLPVFNKLLKIKQQKCEYEKEVLEIDCYKDIENMDDRGTDYYSIATNVYSLSFRKWIEVANIPISNETLNHYRLEGIIAHFIWEITYYGNEAQAKKRAKRLFKCIGSQVV